jgi:hypothetical protein
MKRFFGALLTNIAVGTLACSAHARPAIMDAGQLDPASIAKFYKKPGYSPYAGRNYPTSGSRIIVRFFGGFDFDPKDAQTRSPAEIGYAKGVPMGGDLRSAPADKAPSFLIWVLRDVDGANLDRIQIIKGWLDSSGKTEEMIYDVAWSNPQQRRPGADGKLPPVGNTVNVQQASCTNAIGAPALEVYWRDPAFNPAERAFYYVRVIEIPTPRWTTYDSKFFGVKLPDDVPASIQERAYTSPIWYTP